jgi:spore coat polysaccharide biosynthesis protein SpsF
MKIGCLLSVREKATRLPKKALLDILGMPLTTCLLKRLCLAQKTDAIILTTSTNPADDILETLANQSGFANFRGSELDKLDRYYRTAIQFGLDAVIIVDGDDLLCFPEGIDHIAQLLKQNLYDCISLTGLPLGAASTGLTTEALAKVLDVKAEEDTEVWGGYFMGSGFFKTHTTTLENAILQHPNIRLTLDYPEDYTLLTAIFNAMGRIDFTSHELMDLLVHQQPHLTSINQSAQQKYLTHLSKAAKVSFRYEATPL